MNISTLIFRSSRTRTTHSREVLWILATIVAAALGTLFHLAWPFLSLGGTRFTTGYALFVGILLLASLQLRKKAPLLLPGKVSSWVKWHVRLAWLMIALFAYHAGHSWPRNGIEVALSFLFVATAASGLYGFFISRVLPPQLRSLREEIRYEEIAQRRFQLAREARELVLSPAANAVSLTELYRERLLPFLERPRGLLYYLYPTRLRCHRLIGDVNELRRYLGTEQQAIVTQLSTLLSRKDELDLHAAWQGRLKLWLFVHIGFTYALIVLGAWHGLLMQRYHGGG